ncbi:DUF6392 family protein [Pseudomonas libanensis]|uniref:Pyocin immunity protein n=1 Tax=Pseudomonas libanensis TaxID=75588 RepID=A0ABR5M6A7_9PSED|nr:DUF6392 family protein [Pseudomonas libanensis]KPG74348.1 pyocin immunity protein [Pseudomonas libanensis]
MLTGAPATKLWVESLGLGFIELVASGKISNQPLVKPFEDSDWPTMRPVEGVELLFNDRTKSLKQILITLIPTVGQPVYAGQLPQPLKLDMDQRYVREVLGVPIKSKPSVKLPGGLGMRGGADIYHLDQKAHPNVMVTLSYLENFRVNNISFSLIDSGHD